ncbi:MAG TPA: 50S ribosomal protein L37ae [Thermoplasmata archaeon]|nr:50S ribosomal protein L37ae [Thermoplasmata archaeon]
MSQRTKKVGPAGWMGPRYGIRIRRRVVEIDRVKTSSFPCPRCATVTLRRVASGIFECARCRTRFASNAYAFSAPPPITRTEAAAKPTANR